MKSVIITGASRGIGAELARQFALSGYYVFINYNSNKQAAESVLSGIKQAGGGGEIYQADVTKESQVYAMITHAHSRCGGIDALINNAGVCGYKLFTDITEADWQQMFDVNVKGVFLCSKHVLTHMIAQKSGSIINVSSMWGITGASCEVHYSASKAAVIGLTKALAKEVGLSNITVNCIAPGVIETGMLGGLTAQDLQELKTQTPLNRIGQPSDIAALALYLAGDGARFVTGQVISPNGGMVI